MGSIIGTTQVGTGTMGHCCHVGFKLLVLMPPWVLEALNFLQLGVSSNWFGFVCPPHCRGVGIGGLAASFLAGVICGSLLVAWFGFRYFWGSPVAPVPQPASSSVAWAASLASSFPRPRPKARLAGFA